MIVKLLHVAVWTIAVCRRFQNTLKETERSAQKRWPAFAFSTLERYGQKGVVGKFEKYCEGSIHYFLTQFVFVFFTRTGQYMLIMHEVYDNLEVSDKTKIQKFLLLYH